MSLSSRSLRFSVLINNAISGTMAGRDAQSVPWFAEDRPQAVIADGVRLDGRPFEEFRSVCE